MKKYTTKKRKYVKQPIPIEAFQWDGNQNTLSSNITSKDLAKYFNYSSNRKHKLLIKTMEGYEKVPVGNFIIQGIHGEYYSCNPKIFKQSYKKYNQTN